MLNARTPFGLLASLPLLGLLGACHSGGTGSVPDAVVELYDQADPAGKIEIELERDGTVREMEVDIPISALPREVREAALAKAPGALIFGAEREFHAGGDMWEVKLWFDGRDWEFVIDEDGRIEETEKMLHRYEWPLAIVAAADAALPGGFVKSVELLTHRKGGTSYHVKKELHGASYKLVLSPDGTVQRKVREQPAEIEIPLE